MSLETVDSLEVLDKLIPPPDPPPSPTYRFQGILLFFSISLGALGLGASLAYFSREVRVVRPRRKATKRQRNRTIAISNGNQLRDRKPLLPKTTKSASATTLTSATVPIDATRPDLGASKKPTVSTVTDSATLAKATSAVPSLPPKISETVPRLEPLQSLEPLDPQVKERAEKVLERLKELLLARYDYRLPPIGPLSKEVRTSMPSWMNLTYLGRLTKRARDAAGEKLSTSRVGIQFETFGSGFVEFQLGSKESPDIRVIFEKPPAKTRVALVVDDVGYGGPSTRSLLNLRTPFSAAILPFYPGSSWAARTTLERDLESMLHLPMQPKGAEGKYRKNIIIGPHLKAPEIVKRARKAIESLPGIRGVNNHMGSRATESWFVMSEVLPIIQSYRLFFVDSVTSSKSVAFRSAKKLGLKAAKRTTSFLDNDPSYVGVRDAFNSLLKSCGPKERHVAILHDKPDSVKAMKEAIAKFRKRAIELAFAGDLVR